MLHSTHPARSSWYRAAIAVATVIPLAVGGVAVAHAADAVDGDPVAAVVVETVEAPELLDAVAVAEVPVAETAEITAPFEAPEPAVEDVPEVPAVAPVESPAPQGLASTGDPQDPAAPTATATYPDVVGQTWNNWRPGPLTIELEATSVRPAQIAAIFWKLEGAQNDSGEHAGTSLDVVITKEGITTLTYYALDTLDQVSAEKTIEFKIDSTAPAMQVVSPTTSGVYHAGDEILIDLDYSDNHLRTAYFEFLDTHERIITGNPFVAAEGIHPVRAYALDEAGNETIVDYTITVLPAADVTAPVVTVATASPLPASGWWTSAVAATFSAADGESALESFEYRKAIEGGGWMPWAMVAAIPSGAQTVDQGWQFFGSGVYAMQFRATDVHGNQSDPAEFLFQVDKEISGATVSGFPVTFAQGEVYELHYTCSDAMSGVASCTSSNGPSGTLLPTDVAGDHSFTLTNTDVAGNTKTTTWNYTVGDDAIAPEVTVTSAANGWVNNASVDVTVQATDDSSGIAQLWVEASGANPLSGRFVDGASYLFTATEEGETTISTYAIDVAGNRSWPVTYTVQIDRTAPTIDITKPANNLSLTATKSFTQGEVVDLAFECADVLSGIDSCEATGVTGTALPTDALGTHSIDFVAVDSAGNTTTRTLDYTVVAAPAQGGSNPGTTSGLASTGLEIWASLLLVAGLMAAGVSFLTVSRARR